jgi:hypothetical protein
MYIITYHHYQYGLKERRASSAPAFAALSLRINIFEYIFSEFPPL